MELVQSRGEWVARQRGEIQSNGTLKVWPDKSAVDNDNPKTRDLTRTLGALRPRKHPRSLTERLRTTESVHVYDNLGELVRNGSFEGSGNGSLDGWSGGQVKNYSNISRLSRQPTQEDGYAAVFNGTTISQDVPAIIHDAGPKSALKIDFDFVQNENSTPNLLWAETRIALDNTWYIQGRNPDIPNKVKSAKDGTLALGSTLNGNNGTLLIPSGTTLPVFEFIGNATHSRVTLTEPAYAGDDALQCQIPRDIPAGSYLIYWVWSDTQTSHTYNGSTTNYWGLHVESKDYPGSIDGTTLKPQKIQVPMHAPDGTNLAGRDLSFAIETDTDAKGFLDHVSAQLVINDEPVEQTSYTALDDQSGRNIEITQLLGDGPRFGHPRRLQLSGVDLTQDWKVGPYAAGDARSGQLIEEITAEAAMRQQRDTLQRRTHTVELRGSEELWPQDVFTINGDLYTVTYMQRSFGTGGDRVRVELTRLKDAGTSGLERTFQMESGTAGSAGGTTGGRGGSGGGGSVSAAWSDIIDKPTGFLVRDGDSDGFSDTLPATKAQIESWMRTLTGRSNRSDTRGQ